MNKPIGPKLHRALDYGFRAIMASVPRMLGLDRRARALFTAFGVAQGSLNALTNQPLAVKHLVPFQTHGLIEKCSLPPMSGAWFSRRRRGAARRARHPRAAGWRDRAPRRSPTGSCTGSAPG